MNANSSAATPTSVDREPSWVECKAEELAPGTQVITICVAAGHESAFTLAEVSVMEPTAAHARFPGVEIEYGGMFVTCLPLATPGRRANVVAWVFRSGRVMLFTAGTTVGGRFKPCPADN